MIKSMLELHRYENVEHELRAFLVFLESLLELPRTRTCVHCVSENPCSTGVMRVEIKSM